MQPTLTPGDPARELQADYDATVRQVARPRGHVLYLFELDSLEVRTDLGDPGDQLSRLARVCPDYVFLGGSYLVTEIEPASGAPAGACYFCGKLTRLPAVYAGDGAEAGACADCHANAGYPTMDLAVVLDERPAYVVSIGDLARLAGRPVTDAEARQVADALSIADALYDAVAQVCGLPDEFDG